jgi:hypothetical protein
MISLVRPPGDAEIIRAAPDTPGCASHAKRWVLTATILGSSIAFLEASIINVALPAIQGALGASGAAMQWIASLSRRQSAHAAALLRGDRGLLPSPLQSRPGAGVFGHAHRRRFADTALPAAIEGNERALLERVIGEGFVDSFRWVALLSAGCTLSGAVGALAMIRTAPATGTEEGEPAMATCPHLDQIVDVTPRTRGCEECLRRGDSWVHLRLCLSCGHVGCCDSSKNRHATAHFWASQHPIVRSFEPGEDWRWCYVDELVV